MTIGSPVVVYFTYLTILVRFWAFWTPFYNTPKLVILGVYGVPLYPLVVIILFFMCIADDKRIPCGHLKYLFDHFSTFLDLLYTAQNTPKLVFWGYIGYLYTP